MKNIYIILLAIAMILLLLSIGCSSDNDESNPVDQNKYAWVVGDVDSNAYGNILYTHDGGETWERQGDPNLMSNIDLQNLAVYDKNTVWVVGVNYSVFKTNDGGKTWEQVSLPPNPRNPTLFSISMPDPFNVWISGSDGLVMKTANGGNSWTVYDTSFFKNGGMQGIHALDANNVFVAGQYNLAKGARGFIAYTYSGGNTWDTIGLPENHNKWLWIGVKATSLSNILVYGEKGHYTVTRNGGVTWIVTDSVASGGIGGDINDLIMLTQDIYWAACDYDQIFRTTNSGSTWIKQQAPPPGNAFLFGIDALDKDTALVVSISAGYLPAGKILKTTDGGNTWILKKITSTNLTKVAYSKR